MEKGEGERCIYVAETAISRVLSADRTVTDRQGRKSIVIRNPSTKRARDGEKLSFNCFNVRRVCSFSNIQA